MNPVRLILFLLTTAACCGSELVRNLAAGRARKVVVYGTSLTASGPWIGQMQSWLLPTRRGIRPFVGSQEYSFDDTFREFPMVNRGISPGEKDAHHCKEIALSPAAPWMARTRPGVGE